MAQVSVGITNTNPVRRLIARAPVTAQKSIDGLTYAVTKADGTTVAVPPWIVDAFFTDVPAAMPMIDRPKGATSK